MEDTTHQSKQPRDRESQDVVKSSKKRHRKDDTDEGKSRKHKHKHHHHKDESKDKKSKKSSADNQDEDEDMWVEKNIDVDGDRPLATTIPTAESLKITSSAIADPQKRDDWMLAPQIFAVDTPASSAASSSRVQLPSGDESLTEEYGETSQDTRTASGGVDFFSTLGTDVKKKPRQGGRPDPDKPPVLHYKELNTNVYFASDGTATAKTPDAPTPSKTVNVPGGPGSQWRMMRLKRVYETAEEEGRSVEQVAVERFESLELFEEAVEERRILDERQGGRRGREPEPRRHQDSGYNNNRESNNSNNERFMFTDMPGGSAASSRSSSFRRPGMDDSRPSTPRPPLPPANRRFDSLRLPSQASSPLAQQSHTPIPSVMTPSSAQTSKPRGLSPSALNRLQAKVLRAKLMDAPNAAALEREYEEESKRATGVHSDANLGLGGASSSSRKVEVLPTLDAQGRLYDVGYGKQDGDDSLLPGNRRKKEKHFDTHDPKTGDLVRYNADDDTTTLGEMLRQERFGAGMADQKNLDAEFAKQIMGDGKFQNNLDYIDDNAAKLGRQKMRTDAMKRQFAVHDYKRTQKAMDSCQFCFGADDDKPPQAPLVAMGTRVYLSCTLTDELVKGHCLIVPMQHHLNMLEADDDVWDEVRNFMKCLMRMFADEDQGVIFYETVISLKWQKHTCIECVPLPWEQYELIPGYFKESILASEAEWSQHKKLIDFGSRPGGFRRAMVPNLPYFMVQFDHKGEKGYGHVIEGTETAEEDSNGLEEGSKGGGEFPKWFAAEIIGNVLEIDARRWRRPRRIDSRANKERVREFKAKYDKFDWTGMIGRE